MEGWRVGGLEGWRVGGLEGWRVGGLEGWRVGGLEQKNAGNASVLGIFAKGMNTCNLASCSINVKHPWQKKLRIPMY